MNRKQKRDQLRAHRGEGGMYRHFRKAIFGAYGVGLTAHFESKRMETK